MAGRFHPKALVPPIGAATPVGGGKNAQQVQMGSPHAGVMNPLTKGDPMSRMTNHYKKGHNFGSPSLSQIRGGAGSMRSNPRQGGLGPGPMSTVGPNASSPAPSADYSMVSPDTE